MSRLDPAVAAGRLAVRPLLHQMVQEWASVSQEPALVLVACSGGADSLALSAVCAFEAPRVRLGAGLRAGAVVVDHGLLEGSAQVAQRAADQCRGLGLDPVRVVRVQIASAGGGQGLEAAAREARYAALESTAQEWGAAAVLLAHTQDDQAESVLLAMARGAGLTALTGMAPQRGLFCRPFLQLTRLQTEAITVAEGLEPWQDPTNFPGGPYASLRSQVRADVMPTAIRVLGANFPAALARTAQRLREDQSYLEQQANQLLRSALLGSVPQDWTASDLKAAPLIPVLERTSPGPAAANQPNPNPLVLDAATLAAAPNALRRRALREAALLAGALGGSLNSSHLEALDALLINWHGQGAVYLPGSVQATRKYGKLELRANHSTQ